MGMYSRCVTEAAVRAALSMAKHSGHVLTLHGRCMQGGKPVAARPEHHATGRLKALAADFPLQPCVSESRMTALRKLRQPQATRDLLGSVYAA